MSAKKIIRHDLSNRSELIYDIHEFGLNHDTREIYLHGYIQAYSYEDDGSEPGVDYRMCSNFIKNLHILTAMDSKKPILIHMSTGGGCWNYGMAIYDAIHFCPNQVTILAYAHARSMSSIIIQAADYRILMPNTDFLIHFGTTTYDGDAISCETEGDQAKKCTLRMLEVYAERVVDSEHPSYKGKSQLAVQNKLRKIMNEKREWDMTSQEAIEMNLIDAVLGDEGYENVTKLREENINS